MANKIISLTPTITQISSVQYVDTYRDISMESKYLYKLSAEQQPDIMSYLKFLRSESTDEILLTNLSAIIKERQSIEDTISQIALVTNTSYYKQLKKYNKWKNNPRYKLQKLSDVQAIKNSLNNIFTWIPGQRILNPEFGTNLYSILYNGLTPVNKELVCAEIKAAIAKFDTRINVLKIEDYTTTEDEEQNTIHLEIIYNIPTLTGIQQYNQTLKYNKAQI